MFGSCQVSWNWLTSVTNYSQKHQLATSALCFRREIHAYSDGNDLVSLRDVVHRTRSTDPRDKVYALPGLLNPVLRSLIQPNYENPVASVFAQATYASIAASGAFDLLALRVRGSSMERHSWAYDFTVFGDHDSTATQSRLTAVASVDLLPKPKQNIPTLMEIMERRFLDEEKAHVAYEDERQALRVRGRVFDLVEAVGSSPKVLARAMFRGLQRSQNGQRPS